MRLTTWNVLHRIHAVNWKEATVLSYPDERLRIAGIAQKVTGWLGGGADVVCLQEASGDLLAELRARVGTDVTVVNHRLTRLPRLRDAGDHLLEDPSEHLLVLARGAARLREAATFESDLGKGMMAVEVEGDVVVVNTHVSFGPRGQAQLERLAAVASTAPRAVVCGDMNATARHVAAALGEGLTLAPNDRPTRVAAGTAPPKTIDHVAVRGLSVTRVDVVDGGGLSDHLPVAAVLTG